MPGLLSVAGYLHTQSAQRILGDIKRRSLDGTYCRECGGPMFITGEGVAHHGSPKEIRHEDDTDHVALAEEEKRS